MKGKWVIVPIVAALAGCTTSSVASPGSKATHQVPTNNNQAPPTTQAAPPTTQPLGPAASFTANGFRYTVAAAPFYQSIYNQYGTPAPAPPGEIYWELPIYVHNVQTDREAPLGPAYTTIDTVGTNSDELQALGPPPGDTEFIGPGQTVEIVYESPTPMPQTQDPSSLQWVFVTSTNTDLAAGTSTSTGPQLVIPS